MKILKWSLLAVVLLVIIVVTIVWLNLNRIVRTTVESQSTKSLNQKTSLGAANVSLFGGKVGLHNFEITSPQGFNAPQMMSLGGLDVAVKLGDLRGDPIRVSSIVITEPKMVLELQGTQFNIRKFIDSLPAGEEKPTGEGKPSGEEKPLKLIIDELDVNGAQVVLDLKGMTAIPGLQKAEAIRGEYVLSIPNIQMKEIGSGEGNKNGAAVKEVVSMLITELASKAAQSEQIPPAIRQILSGDLNAMEDALKAKLSEEAGNRISKATADLGKKLPPAATQMLGGKDKDAGQAIEKGIGDLLGGKKKSTTQKK